MGMSRVRTDSLIDADAIAPFSKKGSRLATSALFVGIANANHEMNQPDGENIALP